MRARSEIYRPILTLFARVKAGIGNLIENLVETELNEFLEIAEARLGRRALRDDSGVL